MLVLLLGLLISAALTGTAFAADDPAGPSSDDRPEIALRLSPAVLEIPHEAGPSRHELRVDNVGSQPLAIETQLSEFTVTEDGTTQFLGPEQLSAAAWVTLDVDSFELAPGERRDVTLTVEVPENAEPGERYVSVIFTVPGDPDSGGNISVTHRVAVKLYVAVPGARIERIELGELSGPRLIDAGPATFELTMHNRGNVHRQFQEGTQLLATSRDDDVAFENFTVLGGSTRVVEAVWPDPPTLCWCTVEVEVTDGQGNLLTASTRVVAFPLRLSLALLTLTVGLGILAVAQRRRRTARFDRRVEAAVGRERASTASAPAAPACPLAHETTSTRFEPPVIASPETQPHPLDGRMYTAHGTPDRQRRGRSR